MPRSFLLMQAGDRSALALQTVVQADLSSPDPSTRLAAIGKLIKLFATRFDVLAHPLPERARRRPFRLARHQIDFVPTDCGTPDRVGGQLSESVAASPSSNLGAALPAEVRRALSELGWDAESTAQSTTERQRAALSVLPIRALHVADQATASSSASAVAAPLLRRKSSDGAGGSGSSGKPVLVPALASLLVEVARLAFDPIASVAAAAREGIALVMRDDATTVARPMLEDLGSGERQRDALGWARMVLLVHHQLPPALSHGLFNHLAGGA